MVCHEIRENTTFTLYAGDHGHQAPHTTKLPCLNSLSVSVTGRQ